MVINSGVAKWYQRTRVSGIWLTYQIIQLLLVIFREILKSEKPKVVGWVTVNSKPVASTKSHEQLTENNEYNDKQHYQTYKLVSILMTEAT